MFAPLGASKARNATVQAFVEAPFKTTERTIRPDGVLRISYGKKTWTAIIEVKSGPNPLLAEQINAYWDIARHNDFDAVVTISNEIAPSADDHPTTGLKVKANSRVKVHHYSWAEVLTKAVMVKVHQGVEDPDQAWILGELIRYLEHPASGAMTFDDMGSQWVKVRDEARINNLHRSDTGVIDTANRWDQLLRFASLRLGSEIGEDVMHVLTRTERRNPSRRIASLSQSLAEDGTVEGSLRIPNTVGDITIRADLRARQISAEVTVGAPGDRGARARCTWLIRQLRDVDSGLLVESYPKNTRLPYTATLNEARDNPNALIGQEKREPHRFRLVTNREMGTARKAGKKGFIDSVLSLVTDFYESVVQNLSPWTPPAPKIQRSQHSADVDDPSTSD